MSGTLETKIKGNLAFVSSLAVSLSAAIKSSIGPSLLPNDFLFVEDKYSAR